MDGQKDGDAMSDRQGWTLGDLEGELWARGLNIDHVPQTWIESALNYRHPEDAADFIARGLEP